MSAQRGQSLLETLIAMAIVLGVAAAGLAVAGSQHPGSIGDSGRELGALLAQARVVAANSPSGATVVVGPGVCPGTNNSAIKACLFDARPIGVALPAEATTTIVLPDTIAIPQVGGLPYAIFFSPSGLVGATTWPDKSTVPVSEPVCATTLPIYFGGTNGTQGILDCVTGSFTFPATAPSPGATARARSFES